MGQFWAKVHWTLYWLILPVVIAFGCARAVDAVFNSNPLLNELEWKIKDGRRKELAKQIVPKPNENIVLVPISNADFSSLPVKNGKPSRKVYAQAITKLSKLDPTAVFLSATLDEPDEDDAELGNAIRDASSRCHMLMTLSMEDGANWVEDPHEPDGFRYKLKRPAASQALKDVQNVSYVYPFSLPQLPETQILLKKDVEREGKFILGSGLAIALATLRIPFEKAELSSDRDEVSADFAKWKIRGNWDFDVFAFPRPTQFAQIPILELLNKSEGELSEMVKDKVVIIGSSEPLSELSLLDTQFSPTEWQAHAANTLLTYSAPPYIELGTDVVLIYLVCVGMVSAVFARLSFSWIGWAGLITVLTIVLALPLSDWLIGNRIIETVTPVLVAIAAFLVAGISYFVLPPPKKHAGHSYVGTAVFLDIVGSTEILQEIGAQRYRKFFSEWCNQLDRLANKIGSEIERTTGDGVFLVISTQSQGGNAACALAFVRSARAALQQIGKREALELECRGGLESGPVTGAYVREGGRPTWSSSGPVINLARRLMDERLEDPRPFRLGPTIRGLVSDEKGIEEVQKFLPKGFTQEISIFVTD